MSNAFTNFLSGVGAGIFGTDPDLKDFQHADRLYVKNGYARTPKVGFLYFVNFNINNSEKVRARILDKQWLERAQRDVGVLVKKIDLPKFKIATETLNQYNRKTVIQTKLTYDPIKVEFHDDNSDITNKLWKNYWEYYYTDGIYSGAGADREVPEQFGDTKYGLKDYPYGFDNFQTEDFFKSIDIYVLHKGKGSQDFTQITLINPKITDWSHDQLDQNQGNNILTKSMTVAYETVQYKYGKIVKGDKPTGFSLNYYDNGPSPLSIGGGIPSTLFGNNGVLAGAASVFGSLANARSPLDFLGAAIQARNLAQGARNLNRTGLRTEGYSVLRGVLGDVVAAGRGQFKQPGGVITNTQEGIEKTNSGAQGTVGVNLFSGKNTSVTGNTVAKPKNITGTGD